MKISINKNVSPLRVDFGGRSEMMNTYDAACPVCGKVNHDLYLEETEGWMECEFCGTTAQNLAFRKGVKIPVFRMDQMQEVEEYFIQRKTG